MLILGLETSCDETAAAVVEQNARRGFKILANLVSSQINLHKKTKGVVPEVAARAHVVKMMPVVKETLKQAKITLNDIDLIAVTAGPGLIPALLVGSVTAKTLAYALNVPIVSVHHLEAHFFAHWLKEKGWFKAHFSYPLLCLTVSGGHSTLFKIARPLQYQILGETRDDAAGEAFDKVAKLLDLGYPGGPVISKWAKKGDPQAISFPRPMIDEENFDFSFAGLKTAVLYFVRQQEKLTAKTKRDICASFQEAVTDVLVEKTFRAAKKIKAKKILVAGGVAANQLLRKKMEKAFANQVLFPPLSLCTDNAAMVTAAGFWRYKIKGVIPWQEIEAESQIKLK